MGIPLVGTWMHWLIFGGDFPGTIIIPRLYVAHVLLFPGIMLALIAAHVAIVWYQKHTQFPGPGRTEKNVVGARIVPVFAADQGAFFMFTLGIVAVMGGVAADQPDLEPRSLQPVTGLGRIAARLLHDVDRRSGPSDAALGAVSVGRYTVPAAFWVALMMGLVFTVLIAYPWIEKRLTGDTAQHNLLQRPRDVPVRTAIGAMAIAFYVVLTSGLCQRHHRAEVRCLAERDDLDLPDRAADRCRRSPTSWPTGCAWVCSAATARCSSTVSRPVDQAPAAR